MSTKNEIERAERQLSLEARVYYEKFANLFHNNIKVENLPETLPKRYLLDVLLKRGYIVKDKLTDNYLPAVPIGFDKYALPTDYEFYALNGGFLFRRKAKDVIVLRASDTMYPMHDYLYLQAQRLAKLDNAIDQNVNGCQKPIIFECYDDATMLSIKNMAKAQSVGAWYVFKISEKARTTMKDGVKEHNTGIEYIASDLYELKNRIYGDVMIDLGVPVTTTQKAERVQAAEVFSATAPSRVTLKILIDTFNHDAEVGGLPIRLVDNVGSPLDEAYNEQAERIGEGQNDDNKEVMNNGG